MIFIYLITHNPKVAGSNPAPADKDLADSKRCPDATRGPHSGLTENYANLGREFLFRNALISWQTPQNQQPDLLDPAVR